MGVTRQDLSVRRSPATAAPASPAVPAPQPFSHAQFQQQLAASVGVALLEEPPAAHGEVIERVPDALLDRLRTPTFSCLLGSAGTGKTTLVRQWEQESEGGLVVCATTGIAAVNVGGTTINSYIKFFDTRSLLEMYTAGYLTSKLRKLRRAGLRRLLIDECSMLDANQLTCFVRAVNEVNGAEGFDLEEVSQEDEGLPPLGLTLVGDFCQLSPVKAPFAFESPEWGAFADSTVVLDKVWRQKDPTFLAALHAARRGDGRAAAEVLRACFVTDTDMEFAGPTLLAKNDAVERHNKWRLDALTTPVERFLSHRWGENPPSEWKHIPGSLELRQGAKVMVLANCWDPDSDRYLYVNGDLGTFEGTDGAGKCRVAIQRTKVTEAVAPVTREQLEPLEEGEKREQKALGRAKGKMKVVGEVTYMPLRVAYATTVHKCVAPHTRIQTLQHGVTTIRNLRVGDLLPTGVVKAVARTEQAAYRITTQLGYTIDCSADHRWVTEAGLRPTTELLVGVDRIQLALGRPSGGIDFAEDDAYWLGLLVGDGNYTDQDDGTLHFSSVTDPELGEAFARGALRLGAQRCSWRKDRRGLHTSCRALRKKLLDWGLDYVKAPDKVVPSVIWDAHSGAWAAFLRGLYDADGSVGRSGVIFCTASVQLAQEVQELLLLLGIVSRRQGYPGRRDPYYQVYVGARGLAAFKAWIGFGGIRKRRRLAETLPNRSVTSFEGFDTVASVEALGFWIPMIDIEITAPHRVGFGPFVGHNSQGLSLDAVQINLRDHFMGAGGMLYVALSRARSVEGVRLVGKPETLVARCAADKRVARWY